MSFQIAIAPNRRAAARFIGKVRRRLQKALVDEPNLKRSDIARALDVHRSVITKQLNGHKDMSLGRVAEIAWSLGYEPEFALKRRAGQDGDNKPAVPTPLQAMKVTAVSTGASEKTASIATRVSG